MRVLQVFLASDLRCGHDGLRNLAKKMKIDVDQLQDGEMVVFINSGKDRLKVFASNNVVAYYKTRKGERLELATLPRILSAFRYTGRIDYNKALKETIEEALRRRVSAEA